MQLQAISSRYVSYRIGMDRMGSDRMGVFVLVFGYGTSPEWTDQFAIASRDLFIDTQTGTAPTALALNLHLGHAAYELCRLRFTANYATRFANTGKRGTLCDCQTSGYCLKNVLYFWEILREKQYLYDQNSVCLRRAWNFLLLNKIERNTID